MLLIRECYGAYWLGMAANRWRRCCCVQRQPHRRNKKWHCSDNYETTQPLSAHDHPCLHNHRVSSRPRLRSRTRGALHRAEARYIEPLPWKLAHFSRVYAMGYAELGHDLDVSHAEMKNIAGRLCAVGNLVAFEVDSKFAYDIDEPVELALTYSPEFRRPARWPCNGTKTAGRVADTRGSNVEPSAQHSAQSSSRSTGRASRNSGTRGSG